MSPMSIYKIRPLASADQELLREMLYLSLYVREGDPAFAREILDEPEISGYVSAWGRSGDLGFVAVDADGQALGAAWLRLFPNDERGFGWVDDSTPELGIAVLEGWRGKGIGADLMAHLLDDAARVYTQLSLSVSRENPAVNLYTRFGFEIIRDDGASLTMIKKLTPRIRQRLGRSIL